VKRDGAASRRDIAPRFLRLSRPGRVALRQPASVSNVQGQTAGPFMATIPSGPAGWGSYVYTPVASAGTFTVSNSGDSTSVSVP
jgi:hypothetical protein